MTNERDHDAPDQAALDAFDRDLRALLRVEPSADFMAAVRSRIEDARPVRSAWWWLAPALAAGLFAVLMARVAMRTTRAPVEAPRAVAVASPTPAPVIAPEKAHPAPAVRVTAPRSPRAPRAPEVIVPPGQERALLAFVAAANARGARTLLTASGAGDEPLAPPPPIDIAPLETAPLADPAAPPSRSDS